MRIHWCIGLAAALALVGCSGHASTPHAELSERQRDSVLAGSGLPGASVVGRAMNASDKAAQGAAATNARVDSLFH